MTHFCFLLEIMPLGLLWENTGKKTKIKITCNSTTQK